MGEGAEKALRGWRLTVAEGRESVGVHLGWWLVGPKIGSKEHEGRALHEREKESERLHYLIGQTRSRARMIRGPSFLGIGETS